MIVILSYDFYEQGTESVINWLVNMNASFVKINFNDLFKNDNNFKIDINNKRLIRNNIDITDEISVFYYRRLYRSYAIKSETPFRNQIESEITEESFSIINYLFYLFKDKAWLPTPNMANVNKLVMLNKASQCGFRTPKSLLINNKEDLLNFKKSWPRIITKPVNKGGYYIIGKCTYFPHVNEIDDEQIQSYPDYFYPSLFQELIEHKYEIRVFNLDGEYFAIANISFGERSTVDVKLEAKQTTSAWVPYQVSPILERLLDKFFASINLNTGSLDILCTNKDEFVFLEVNPVGQYGHPSLIGNYYLDKKIAEWLVKKDNEQISNETKILSHDQK